jgi:hypothetical protein
MTGPHTDSWVIYSPNESAISDGAGFWSNEHDWVELDQATHFSLAQAYDVALPMATGHDARFVALSEAVQHYR